MPELFLNFQLNAPVKVMEIVEGMVAGVLEKVFVPKGREECCQLTCVFLTGIFVHQALDPTHEEYWVLCDLSQLENWVHLS